LVGGILAIVIGLFGLLTAKFRNVLVALPFILYAFLVAILCLIAGLVVLSGDGYK